MIKKIVLSSFVIIIVMLSGICVYAEGSTETGERVEISFKVGDETLKINDKDVTVEKPYVVNGVTLVPLRVITEAFGAEVTWNGSDKSIVLEYNNVLIKLVIGKKDAIVDDKKSLLLEAPVIKNGVTMVPMRFITENFGADVGYDNKTQSITVLKEIANSNSIKDFGLLLKKTNKGKVGDSFQNWSISLPKKLKISYRNFNGTINSFVADDNTYSLGVYINTLKDETLESILSDEISDAEEYTLLDQGIKSNGGQSYVKCAAKGESFTYETRKYINNGNIYTVYLSTANYNTYKNNNDLNALLNSFCLKFANDGTTEDLSDINSDGYRMYEDKKLKWSIAVRPDMYEYKDEDKENVVQFLDKDFNAIIVNMYSIEDGLTLDKWIENELKHIKEDYNAELVKIISSEEITLNGERCKKLMLSLIKNGKTEYSNNYYMIGKNYRYEMGYLIKSEAYNDAGVKSKFDAMLNSFRFSEPDKDEIGQLIDPDKIVLSDSTRKVENKDEKWSFEIPVSWTMDEDGEGTNYHDKEKDLSLGVLVYKGIDFNAFAEEFDKALQQQTNLSGKTTIDKKESISDKGTSIIKYFLSNHEELISEKAVVYMFTKNNNVYVVGLSVKELNWCEKNIKLIDRIWQSAKFE